MPKKRSIEERVVVTGLGAITKLQGLSSKARPRAVKAAPGDGC